MNNIRRLLIRLNFHGRRHKISQIYLDLEMWQAKKDLREARLCREMHDNGIVV